MEELQIFVVLFELKVFYYDFTFSPFLLFTIWFFISVLFSISTTLIFYLWLSSYIRSYSYLFTQESVLCRMFYHNFFVISFRYAFCAMVSKLRLKPTWISILNHASVKIGLWVKYVTLSARYVGTILILGR